MPGTVAKLDRWEPWYTSHRTGELHGCDAQRGCSCGAATMFLGACADGKAPRTVVVVARLSRGADLFETRRHRYHGKTRR